MAGDRVGREKRWREIEQGEKRDGKRYSRERREIMGRNGGGGEEKKMDKLGEEDKERDKWGQTELKIICEK